VQIGLSATLLDPLCSKNSDGISVYTHHLEQCLVKEKVAVKKYSFFSKKQSFEKANNLPYPASFPMGSIVGAIGGGFGRLPMSVDVFHATDYRILPMQCPVVATIYDAIPLKNPEYVKSRFRKLKNHVLKRAASYADLVIAISSSAVEELVEYYRIPEHKIRVVHCGVSESWLSEIGESSVSAVLSKRNLRPDYLLFVGTLQPRKNLTRVLDAYERLPKSVRSERQLVIVGKEGWSCKPLLARIKSLEAKGEVVWLKDVNSDVELRCLYAAAYAFLFPSLYEGFGLPVLEAFASRTRVLTSNTTALPEVSNGAAIEVNPLSVEEIASGINVLLHESDFERERHIEKGYCVAKKMTWLDSARKTMKVYQELL